MAYEMLTGRPALRRGAEDPIDDHQLPPEDDAAAPVAAAPGPGHPAGGRRGRHPEDGGQVARRSLRRRRRRCAKHIARALRAIDRSRLAARRRLTAWSRVIAGSAGRRWSPTCAARHRSRAERRWTLLAPGRRSGRQRMALEPFLGARQAGARVRRAARPPDDQRLALDAAPAGPCPRRASRRSCRGCRPSRRRALRGTTVAGAVASPPCRVREWCCAVVPSRVSSHARTRVRAAKPSPGGPSS